MKEYIENRAAELARYIIDTKATVRDTAKIFGVSKSTVHKDITERLEEIDYQMFLAVKEILDVNLAERHLRGGDATRKKFKAQSLLSFRA